MWLPITSYYPRSQGNTAQLAVQLLGNLSCLQTGLWTRITRRVEAHMGLCPDLLAWLHLDCSEPLSPLAGGLRQALGPEYALVCVIQRVPCSGTRTALCLECRISTDITGTSSATWHRE